MGTPAPRRSAPHVDARIGVVNAVAAGQRGGHQGHHLVAGVGSAWGRNRPAPRLLLPCFDPPAQVQMPVNQLGQAQVLGEGGRKQQPGVVDQAVVVESNLDPAPARPAPHCRRGGCVVASIGCSLFRGGFQYKNHYPRFRGAPFHPFIRPLASIGCSLFRGGFQYKNHYPRFRGAPFHPFIRPLITLLRWIRA